MSQAIWACLAISQTCSALCSTFWGPLLRLFRRRQACAPYLGRQEGSLHLECCPWSPHSGPGPGARPPSPLAALPPLPRFRGGPAQRVVFHVVDLWHPPCVAAAAEAPAAWFHLCSGTVRRLVAQGVRSDSGSAWVDRVAAQPPAPLSPMFRNLLRESCWDFVFKITFFPLVY